MQKLRTSDLELLLQLFAEKQHQVTVMDMNDHIVHDMVLPTKQVDEPYQNVLVRASNKSKATEDLILDIGWSNSLPGYSRTVLHVICYPDGRLRWLYPPGRAASIGHFHSAAGWRGRTMAFGLRLTARLGADRFFRHGTITLHHKSPLRIDTILERIPHSHRSFFMGTPGAQRKMGVVLQNDKSVVGFVKVATNARTTDLVRHEQNTLEELRLTRPGRLRIPLPLSLNEPMIGVQSSIRTTGQWRSAEFTNLHAAALCELVKGHVQTGTHVASALAFKIQARLDALHAKNLSGTQVRILHMLDRGISATNGDKPTVAMPAHGDLTPWNTFCSPDELAVYDWEMYRKDAPALYDLFHFHMQQGVIVERLPFEKIRERIQVACELPAMEQLITQYALDVDHHLCIYLLDAVSYFMEIYSEQTELSATQQRQLFAWEEALAFAIPGTRNNGSTHRLDFLQDLRSILNGRAYAALKFRWNRLSDLPLTSDLDLAVDHGTKNTVVVLCNEHPLVAKAQVRKRSFMTVVELYFHDGGFLALDLIHRFQRKELTMLDATELIANARPNGHGLMLPAFKHDLAYAFLFHVMNGSRVPAKYKELFEERSPSEWRVAFAFLNERCSLWFTGQEAFWNAEPASYRPYIRKALRKEMSRMEVIRERLRYAFDTLRALGWSRGFVVTFSGVDGAGKSTVIARVKQELEQTFRREVVMMRHRPGLLPMLNAWRVGADNAEKQATKTLPRTGTNKNSISSLFRFGYYFTDYLLGQWVVYFRHVLRGRIVLYDRYYFDFMADPRRSNIQLDRRFVSSLYTLVMQPKLNFFLYADSATILARKRELSASDVELLTVRYRQLFDRLGDGSRRGRYRTIRNEDLDTTLNSIRYELSKVA